MTQTTQVTHQAHPWQPRWEPSLAEAQLLLDAMPHDRVPDISALPPGSRMPFAPNPHFVGRDAVLLNLAQTLHGGRRVAIAPKAAATGLGGIGTTSVAVEFVHRYGGFFAGGVFWLSCADPAAIPSEIVACGGPGLLDLHPSYGDLTQDTQLTLVRQAWQQPIPRLLIFDNCEAPQVVQQWAPTSGGCRVLLTSRRQRWSSTLGMTTYCLDILPRSASIGLLHQLAAQLTDAEADAIAVALGDFPLALQLAGSFLAHYTFVTGASYVQRLQSGNPLDDPAMQGRGIDVNPTRHDGHVGRTFTISYGQLIPTNSLDALALSLLAHLACLAPGAPIPISIVPVLLHCPAEDLAWQDALARISNLGFVAQGEETLVIHRLVHAYLQVSVTTASWCAVADVINQVADTINDAGYPAAMHPFIPHLRWLTRAADTIMEPWMAVLCGHLGYHLMSTGDYSMARHLCEQALAINQQCFGSAHPQTADSLNRLALLHQTAGQYLLARPLYERALAIREQTLAPTHPAIAQSLNNLAYLYYTLGVYVAARPLYERALALWEQAPGAPDADLVRCLNNLSRLLQAMGATAEACDCAERALSLAEKILGTIHLTTAYSLSTRALLFGAAGDVVAARTLHERALSIRETILGPTHPNTATSLTDLGMVLYTSGDMQSAQQLVQRGLAIREQMLGPLHPLTANSLDSLAQIRESSEGCAAAIPLYDRALTITRAALGAEHPATQAIRASLQRCLALQDSSGSALGESHQ